jgi:hypothetical protein
MHRTKSYKLDKKVEVNVVAEGVREGWDIAVCYGMDRDYLSYDEAKSLWFAVGAALSEFEFERGLEPRYDAPDWLVNKWNNVSGSLLEDTSDPDVTDDGYMDAVVNGDVPEDPPCHARSWDGTGIGGAYCTLPAGHTGTHGMEGR